MRCDGRPDLLLGIVVGAMGTFAVCWMNVPEMRARVSRWMQSLGRGDDDVHALAVKNRRRKIEAK